MPVEGRKLSAPVAFPTPAEGCRLIQRNVYPAADLHCRAGAQTGGVGTIWSFEAFDRTFRVRPSLEWMYQRQTIKGILSAGENEGTDAFFCEPCRLLFIANETEKGYHSLGPGLELEVDVGRAGDFLIATTRAARWARGFRSWRRQ